MFFHLFKNRLKVMLKNKVVIFWTLGFPIILGTLFFMAFSNITASEQFDPIAIAVVETSEYESDLYFQQMMEALSVSGENQLFETQYLSEEDAKKLLETNEIEGYILYEDTIKVNVNKNGFGPTILKNVMDQYVQNSSIIAHLMESNPNQNPIELLESISISREHFVSKQESNLDLTVIYFYTLIGMVCLYGGMFGVSSINESEANMSTKGARVTISSAHKLKRLSASLLASLVIQYSEVLIILGYIIFVLGIQFGSQIGLILLLTFFGCLSGISIGILIGSAFKTSENGKVGILIAITMLMSFLSGMMATNIKYMIDQNLPILSRINPVNMITDGLYALYYYPTNERYFQNVIALIIFSLVMCTISYFFLRRKKYDSI